MTSCRSFSLVRLRELLRIRLTDTTEPPGGGHPPPEFGELPGERGADVPHADRLVGCHRVVHGREHDVADVAARQLSSAGQ